MSLWNIRIRRIINWEEEYLIKIANSSEIESQLFDFGVIRIRIWFADFLRQFSWQWNDLIAVTAVLS